MQGWCISTCKNKANEIMAAAKAIHPDAIIRVVSPHACSTILMTATKDAANVVKGLAELIYISYIFLPIYILVRQWSWKIVELVLGLNCFMKSVCLRK